jgi:predicted nuclease with TOPRIM domain
LEAYEQLEKDLAKEIDAAVEEKARQVEEARGKLSVTEEELRAQYEEVNQLREQLETLQVRLMHFSMLLFGDMLRYYLHSHACRVSFLNARHGAESRGGGGGGY